MPRMQTPPAPKPAATHRGLHASELLAHVGATIRGRGLPEPTSGSLNKPSPISPKRERDDHVKNKEVGSPYSKVSYGALPLCSVVPTHRGQGAKPRYITRLAETHSHAAAFHSSPRASLPMADH